MSEHPSVAPTGKAADPETHATDAHAGAPEHAPTPTAFGLDAPAWIALAMVFVLAILIWKRVPGAIGKALDRKIEGIREQLDEAKRLRAEADALRAEYEAKQASAEADAATLIERARHEADAIRARAEQDAAGLIERRTRMAEDRIAAAERAALAEVRGKAVDAAAAAAERLIRERLDAGADKAMIDETIAGLGAAH
jgi:F-type H+-transporting ATPase subunit b